MRSARGYTLIEVLVATALFGIVAAFAFDVADRATREGRASESRQEGFERRELAALRLRAAAARATSARMDGNVLALRETGDGGDEGGESRWCLKDGIATRTRTGPCEVAAFRLDRRARGVVIVVPGDRPESILVGEGAR
jgi:prepilin-type N-terminal cleavage/methylation domain-containing protein